MVIIDNHFLSFAELNGTEKINNVFLFLFGDNKLRRKVG